MEPVAAPAPSISRADLVGVALAAGAGTRLDPLTQLLPKALCPVGNRALVDLALDRIGPLVGSLAVNAHHGSERLQSHIGEQWSEAVTVSLERDEPLGTAGGIGRLRPWIDGRGVVVVNADGWTPTPLDALLEGWDGQTVRVMVNGGSTFGPSAKVVASTLPWRIVERLDDSPAGLYERVWRDEFERGELEVVSHNGVFIDCGTPLDYLRANLETVVLAGASVVADGAEISASATVTSSVIGAGARVFGDVEASVVWPGQVVESGERLIRSIRAGTSVTVGPL
ncbi:MAG: sugar phosphate nucleotidyltransferase [Actinobacteria bacterium]|nr:sugar phosphate nucleotidyltransferase [Actinomycetota bacterium]